MKFLTTLDRDEDGIWIAECPSIPGCVSRGSSREEALSNIREAIALCLEVRAERGMQSVNDPPSVSASPLFPG
jgi:predicted RNase H-like HicB family nuclease